MTRAVAALRWMRSTAGALLLCLAWLSGGSSSAQAQAPPVGVRIQPSAVTVVPGGSVTVTVEATAPSGGLGSWTVDVSYDRAVVTATSCAPNVQSVCNTAYAANTVRITGASAGGLQGTAGLADVTFQAAVTGDSSSTLAVGIVTFTAIGGSRITPAAGNGLINVRAGALVGVRIQPASTSVAPGASTTVSVEATAPAAGLGAWTIDITYAPSVVTAAACAPAAGSACNIAYAPNTARIAGTSVAGLSGTSRLADLTFQASSAGGASSPLTVTIVTFADPRGVAVSGTATGGVINVQSGTPVGVRIQPAQANVSPGGSVVVRLEATAPPAGLGAWTVDIAYSPSVVSPAACSPAGSSVCNPAYSSSTIRVTGASPAGVSGTFNPASITFQALGAPGTSAPLTLTAVTFTDPTGARVTPSIGNGLITVVTPTPALTGLSPARGPAAGGTTVTITGTNFSTVAGATAVQFGLAPAAAVNCTSATNCAATSPAGSGTVDVTVTVDGRSSSTSPASKFTYVPPPSVSGISPTSGPPGGGTSVSISGANFSTDSGATAVVFGTAPATAVSCSSTTACTAISPPGSGVVDVLVTAAGQTSAASAATKFTYSGVPAAPSGLQLAGPASTSTIPLRWTDTSADETSFQVGFVWSSPGAVWQYQTAAANTPTATVSGLLPGNRYSFAVRSCNDTGCSAWSDVISALTAGSPPATPANPRAGTVAERSIQLLWDDISKNEALFQVAYVISTSTMFTYPVVTAGVTSYTITNLVPGGAYYLYVRACNAAGCSPYTTPITVRAGGVPAAPTGLQRAALGDTSAQVTWTDASTNELVFQAAYVISTDTMFTYVTLPAETTTYTATGLTPGAVYYFYVRACNAAGCSAYTPGIAIRIGTVPAVPQAPHAGSVTDVSAQVLWTDASTNETGFQVAHAEAGIPLMIFDSLPAGSTAATLTGLTPGATYYVYVRACNAAGCSSWTAPLTIRTSGPPAAPARRTAPPLPPSDGGPGTAAPRVPDILVPAPPAPPNPAATSAALPVVSAPAPSNAPPDMLSTTAVPPANAPRPSPGDGTGRRGSGRAPALTLENDGS